MTSNSKKQQPNHILKESNEEQPISNNNSSQNYIEPESNISSEHFVPEYWMDNISNATNYNNIAMQRNIVTCDQCSGNGSWFLKKLCDCIINNNNFCDLYIFCDLCNNNGYITEHGNCTKCKGIEKYLCFKEWENTEIIISNKQQCKKCKGNNTCTFCDGSGLAENHFIACDICSGTEKYPEIYGGNCSICNINGNNNPRNINN